MTKISTVFAIAIALVVGSSSAYADPQTDSLVTNHIDRLTKTEIENRNAINAHDAAIKALRQQLAGNQATPAPAASIEGTPQTKRFVFLSKYCSEMSTMPIREQQAFADTIEKWTPEQISARASDCYDPNWRRKSYEQQAQAQPAVQTPDDEDATPQQATMNSRYYNYGYQTQRREMYAGDRELLQLQSLGPYGHVRHGRAPMGAIPCMVRGIRGMCVPK